MKRFKYFLLAALGAVIISFVPMTGMATLPVDKSIDRSLNQSLSSSPQLAQVNRLSSFIEADGLYRQGQKQAAETIYRQLKPTFSSQSVNELKPPIYDSSELSAGGAVYWRNAQAAMESGQESVLVTSLGLLSESEPEFIPGTLLFADYLMEQERPEEAVAALDAAVTQYPDVPELVMKQAQALSANDQHLEASIAAREFSILYLDHPQASEFDQMAEDELGKFMRDRRTNSLGAGILNIGASILTGQQAPWESLDSAMAAYEIIRLSLSDEKEFGAQIAAQYAQQLPLIEDPEVVDYVTQIGLSIGRLMGRDLDYEFYVVDDDSLNAFALPGGKIFINKGAIVQANSEAELAGLMGHEVAHSVLSHGVQSVLRDGAIAQLGDQVPIGAFLTNIVTSDFSRQQEKQSDILGTRALSTAGYAADGLRNFMVTLDEKTQAAQARSSQPEYLSSHPASATRVRYLEELIQRNGYNRYALEGVDKHSEIQAKLS